MDIDELLGCCSVVTISYFNNTTISRTHLLNELKDYYEDYLRNCSFEYPRVLIATTRTSEQSNVENVLQELGFTKKKIHSRHKKVGDKPALTFWMRTSLPRELRIFVNNKLRQLRKEGYD